LKIQNPKFILDEHNFQLTKQINQDSVEIFFLSPKKLLDKSFAF